MANLGAHGAVALTRRFLGALDQTTVRDEILSPWATLDLLPLIEEPPTQDLADARDRAQRSSVLASCGFAVLMMASTLSRSRRASWSISARSTAILCCTAGSGHRSATPSRFAW
jgi:hypothetical protein